MIDNKTHWKANAANKKKLDEKEAKFIFDQAEKYLKDTVETSQLIAGRTNTLIAILSGLLVGLIGFTINKIGVDFNLDSISVASIAWIVYLFYILTSLSKNILSENYHILGSQPKKIFVDNFFIDSIEKDRIIRYYVNEIERYQQMIDFNKEINSGRWKIYDRAIELTISTPKFLLFSYIVAVILFYFV